VGARPGATGGEPDGPTLRSPGRDQPRRVSGHLNAHGRAAGDHDLRDVVAAILASFSDRRRHGEPPEMLAHAGGRRALDHFACVAASFLIYESRRHRDFSRFSSQATSSRCNLIQMRMAVKCAERRPRRTITSRWFCT